METRPRQREDSDVIAESEISLAPGRVSSARRRLAVAGAIAALLASLIALFVVRWHVVAPYAGDEPHYLVITNSLILDGDVDVKNDYVDARYHQYYPFPLDPHVNSRVFTSDSPHWYSEHGVGLAALLVPAVLVDGADGARAAMVIVAAALLLLTFLWARRFTGGSWPAAAAVAALGVSPCFLGLEGRIFPDLTMAALLVGCLLILEKPDRQPWHLLLLSTLVGVSPWFHYKNVLAFGTVLAIAVVQVARSETSASRRRSLLLLAAPAVISAIGYELAIRAWYDSWLPTRMAVPTVHLFALNPLRGIAAVSFDSARGLFTNGPALMLIFAGVPIWLARSRGPFLRLMLIIAPTILVQATFSDWSGGYTSPARYALDFVPALIPAIALFLREAPLALKAFASATLALSWALAAAFVWLRPPWVLTGYRNPLFAGIDRHLGLSLDRGMPAFDYWGKLSHGSWELLAWAAAAGTLAACGAVVSRGRAGRRAQASEQFAKEPAAA